MFDMETKMQVSARQLLLTYIELLPVDLSFEDFMFLLKEMVRYIEEVARGDGNISSNGDLELKTGKMLRLEQLFHQDIRDLIKTSLKGSDVAQKLGVSEAGISRWRKRLGIQIGRNSGQYVRTNQRGRH